jgi:lipopolysaccharide biosynthesis protein
MYKGLLCSAPPGTTVNEYYRHAYDIIRHRSRFAPQVPSGRIGFSQEGTTRLSERVVWQSVFATMDVVRAFKTKDDTALRTSQLSSVESRMDDFRKLFGDI